MRPGHKLLLDGTADAVAVASAAPRRRPRVLRTALPSGPMTVAHRANSAIAVTLAMLEDGHHSTRDLVADAREHCAELLAALDLVERGS
jgi:hypothetical protein